MSRIIYRDRMRQLTTTTETGQLEVDPGPVCWV